jgi:DNA recombination protein RmuC
LDKAQTRSNVMHRALRQVEALPEGQVPGLLPDDVEESDGEAQ